MQLLKWKNAPQNKRLGFALFYLPKNDAEMWMPVFESEHGKFAGVISGFFEKNGQRETLPSFAFRDEEKNKLLKKTATKLLREHFESKGTSDYPEVNEVDPNLGF